MPVLALSLCPLHFPIAQRTICHAQLFRSFASTISLQEPVSLVPLPVILNICSRQNSFFFVVHSPNIRVSALDWLRDPSLGDEGIKLFLADFHPVTSLRTQ